MSSLFVGVDISGNCLRVAVLDMGQEPVQVQSLSRNSFSCEEELVAFLRKLFTEDFPRPRKVVAAFPARKGFFRRLAFPFADSRKIASALPYELGSHLPVDLEDCLTSFQKPSAAPDGHYLVSAAAVPVTSLEAVLAPFEQAAVPLHVLDMAPFAYAPGLKSGLRESLLVCCNEEEVTVALVEDGNVSDYRLWPCIGEQKPGEILAFIQSQSLFYKNRSGGENLPLCLIGSQVEPELIGALKNHGHRVVAEPLPKLGGASPATDFIPAILLALGAYASKSQASFNFRQGPLALKNDWSSLKKQLYVSGSLAVLAIVALITSLTLNYITRAGTLSRLDKQIQSTYRETFPGSKMVSEVSLHMQSHLRELEKKGALFRIVKRSSTLEVLKDISERLQGIPDLDLRTYYYDPGVVRLEGTTTSFEAVNRMSGDLKQSEMFEDIEIAEAKMSLDGRHVNFRIRVALKGGTSGP